MSNIKEMKRMLIILLLSHFMAHGQTTGTLIYRDDFLKPFNSKLWIAEIEPKPESNSTVYTQNSALILDTRAGVTVWFNKILQGNIRIEYDRKVLVDSGKNDRLSDCNVFWMAQPPVNLFSRNGKFESYDDLQLYYVGMGGNSNSTTRFRKYESVGKKPIIKEYLDSAHLLKANRNYHFVILVNKGATSYWVNGECYFNYTDPSPLLSGYFGFRSTWSRQAIRNFRVYKLD
jgi:rhamnogalacturonan endolyase